jgi:hypothetical protein
VEISQEEIEQQMPEPDPATSRARASQLRAAQAAHTGGVWRASVVVPAGAVACLLIAVVVYFMMKSEASANQSSVHSVDELIKLGERQKALDILQKWRRANIQTAADVEKMDKLIKGSTAKTTSPTRQ